MYTVEEFLASGGKIKQCPKGPETFNGSSKYTHDKQLKALRALKSVTKDSYTIQRLELAIQLRCEVIKASW